MRGKIAVLAAGMIALTACTNYEGKGNDFDAVGKIVKIRDHTFDVRFTDVKIADGRSFRHVKRGKIASIHDNWNECDFKDRHWAGPRARSLKVGKIVHVVGKRRENADSCGKSATYSYRLVSDSVEYLPQ